MRLACDTEKWLLVGIFYFYSQLENENKLLQADG
jgi:hypothetical protein